MTPSELRIAGEALFGSRWQSALARALLVDPRVVRRWVSGQHAVPGPAVVAIGLMSQRERNQHGATARGR